MSTIKVNTITKRTGSTLTLGESGTAVTLACGATQTGFGRTGTVNWCTTAKTSPLTAESGKGYFINTTGGVVTVTLPASPSAGDIVSVKDYARTFACNAVTVGRNGSKMCGTCNDTTFSTEGLSATLIYVDGTKGWQLINDDATAQAGAAFIAATGGTVLTNGDFKTHVFTSSSNFVVSAVGNAAGSNTVEYMVVGGGGSGGSGGVGGSGAGGGGGGFRSFICGSPNPLNASALPVSAQTYPITVGAGEATPGTACGVGSKGADSVFSTITSAGGGAGGVGNPLPGTSNAGQPGGSGGGARGTAVPGNPSTVGGTGNTPPVSPPQGNNGGQNPAAPEKASAGGGGAGAVGSTGGTPQCGAGNGGDGGVGSFIADSVFGPTAPSYGQSPSPLAPNGRYFSGGGAGNGYNAPASGDGGGGGGGATSSLGTGGAGTANTGGGGGGGSGGPGRPNDPGGNGGSGVVVIRYKFQ